MAVEKRVCIVCSKDKYLSKDFYVSYSRVWGKADGKLLVCKDCIMNLFDYYLTEKKLGIRATIIAVCRKFDMYFSDEIFNSAIEDSKKKVGVPLVSIYISKLNITLTNRKQELAFEDSVLEELDNQANDSGISNGVDLTKEQKKLLSDFWGVESYETEADLIILQDMFEKYIKNYSNDFVKREYFKMLCIEHLRLKKTTNTKERKEIMTMITQLTDKANISPKDTEQNKKEDDLKALGIIVKKIESQEPVDYDVKDKALYKDYRSYKKYIEEYFVKPVKKAFSIE